LIKNISPRTFTIAFKKVPGFNFPEVLRRRPINSAAKQISVRHLSDITVNESVTRLGTEKSGFLGSGSLKKKKRKERVTLPGQMWERKTQGMCEDIAPLLQLQPKKGPGICIDKFDP
jgi:hypothetical protein